MKNNKILSVILVAALTLGVTFIKPSIVKAFEDTTPPEFIGVKIDKNILKPKESIIIKISATDNLELAKYAQVCFVKNDVTNSLEQYIDVELINGQYVGKITIPENMDGEWKVSYIVLSDKANNTVIQYNNEVHSKYGIIGKDLKSGDFKIVSSSFDVKVTSVIAEKNTVIKGDKVKLTIATDNIDTLNDQAKVNYVLPRNSISLEKEIMLTRSGNVYEAIINTSEFESIGAWKINSINFKNKSGAEAVVYNNQLNTSVTGSSMNLVTGDLNIQNNPKSTLSDVLSVKFSSDIVKRGSSLGITVTADDSKYKLKDLAGVSLVNKSDLGTRELNIFLKQTNIGVFSGSVPIDDTISKGTWKLNFVAVENQNSDAMIVYNSNVNSISGKDFSNLDFQILEKSNNSKLSSIVLDGVALGDFNSDKNDYKYEIQNGKVPEIMAIPQEQNAKIILLKDTIIPGKATITVVSEDGKSTSTYNINYEDKISDNVLLKEIKINGMVMNLVNDNTFEYVYGLDNNTVPYIEAKVQDVKSVVKIEVPEFLPGDATIKVTSESGLIKVYTIHLRRAVEIKLVSTKTEFTYGEDAKITINAINKDSIAKNASLLIGLFNSKNHLEDYVVANQVVSPNNTVNLSAIIKVPTSGQYNIKAFVWDNIESMKVITDVIEFKVK